MKRATLFAVVLLLGMVDTSIAQPKTTAGRLGEKALVSALKPPNPFGIPKTLGAIAPYYAFSVTMCAPSALILTTLLRGRELRNSEAFEIIASCFLPIIGGTLVRAMFEQHPELDLIKHKPLDRDAVDLMKMGTN